MFVVGKKIIFFKLFVIDKCFLKLIGLNVVCCLVGKKGLKNGNLRWVGYLFYLLLDDFYFIVGVELFFDDKLGIDGIYCGVKYFISVLK